ncbi:MAG TPA: DUF4811 domain-containing protein [Lactobacillaceae bacterium]|jgi:hypothetical protein
MIILFLVIFAVLAFLSAFLIQNTPLRLVATTIMFAGVIASVVGIVANSHDQFGMDKVTTTTKRQIYTAGTKDQGFGMLLYQNIGTDGKSKAYIYRAKADDKDVTVTPKLSKTMTLEQTLENVKVSSKQVATSGNKAYVTTKKTEYVYKADWAKFLFGIANNDHQVIKVVNTYAVPANWLALSTDQAATLKSKQADLKKQAMANPQQAMALAQLQKTNPDKAAALQVQSIKKVLGIK